MRADAPLRELFKDEVRRPGVELGRHGLPPPASRPGPGRAHPRRGEEGIRRHPAPADHIFIEELRKHELYDKVSQAFAVFLPVKSVGVAGDGLRYDYVVALRAVETIGFMTARCGYLPYEFLDHCSRRIVNEIPRISRIVYDITGKPPGTIEWE